MSGHRSDERQPAGELLPPGLYELLVTRRIAAAVDALGERSRTGKLVDEEAPFVLAQHVAAILSRALHTSHFAGLDDQIRFCNELLDRIDAATRETGAFGDDAVRGAELLCAVLAEGRGTLGGLQEPVRPETPLSQNGLLVHAPHEPGFASELRRELASADRVDLLCAFVIWSGVRVLLDELKAARERGVQIRVITTTYTGTTDARSLDELTKLGAEVKVSYDTRATRLHAKAWLFERRSGFSTGYVGSSNLTHSAIHEGLEWNVRLSEISSPDLIERFRATFETYWADPHFEPYDAERFARAVRQERATDAITLTPFDVRPYPFQEAMLERLRVERERHGRWRNLLVAATGTGKTVVSALDYRRLVERWGQVRLLFVAHRKEILDQSRTVFRAVLRDGAFGERYVGGQRPDVGKHVFASVQSLARVDLSAIRPDAYDMVIVDEFHHAEAPTYRRLLDHLRPRVLLGMTATPERMNPEENVTRWFDGRIAVELRLWHALEQRLLCPFQYFGIADEVDLSGVAWRRGGYDVGALSRVYTGDDLRVGKILKAIGEIVKDPSEMRALGFCVSVDHAHYMAQSFSTAGFPSLAISAATPPGERHAAIQRLRAREVSVLFSVDVFSEGLDVPEVDTVLLLRPTESATVFLQQLGRGLRVAPGKSVLTVLDFIGQQRREFRFSARFEALTGLVGNQVIRGIEQQFPYLPAGCSIRLDPVARQTVLDNVRAAIQVRWPVLADELRQLGPVTLAEYLERFGRTLDDVYRPAVGGWSSLQRLAGFSIVEGPDQKRLERAVARMRHVDDDERVRVYTRLLRADAPPDPGRLDERERRLLTMLHFDLWGRSEAPATLSESLRRLWVHPAGRDELVQLLELLADQATSMGRDGGLGQDVPLLAHQRYARDEVLAALGVATPEHPPTLREGVYYASALKTDVFFVTLQKTPGRFSPTTMYCDYAVSPDVFHWESQSTTSATSPTGRRYIQHARTGNQILLFARETSEGAPPFLCLGTATYQSHRGERPMAITWKLEHPLPPDFYQSARAAA